MRVLVTAATRHGSTDEIADALQAVLADAGLEVTRLPPDEVTGIDGFDAVVAGSAVYVGKWLAPAKGFIERHADALRERPVWLFSSGPLGDPPKPEEPPVDAEPLAALVDARAHRTFAGRLEPTGLGFGERAMVRLVRAPDGDHRDWSAIRAWGEEIARDLRPAVSAAGRHDAID